MLMKKVSKLVSVETKVKKENKSWKVFLDFLNSNVEKYKLVWWQNILNYIKKLPPAEFKKLQEEVEKENFKYRIDVWDYMDKKMN